MYQKKEKNRKWKIWKSDRNRYTELKRKFKQLCEKKERCKKIEEIEEIKKAKTEKDSWKYINKERKITLSLGKSITMKNWHKHFCEKLEGRNEAIMRKKGNIGENDEEELADEKIEQQIQYIKKMKARGTDGISGEALKYRKGSSS